MFNKIVKSYWFLFPSTVIVVTFLIFLAYQFNWKYHLEVDIWGFYFPRFKYFLEHLSFANFGDNEYFPGTMFFFLLPGFTYFIDKTWQTYLIGLFIVNIILIVFHLYVYRRNFNLAPYIFLAILLFSGPIILYRHDLFVSFFIILSLILWKSKKRYLSSFILGVATTIKIYPVLIFPYLIILTLKKRKVEELFKIISFYTIGIISIVIIYLILGSSYTEILEPIRKNSIKPVHIESLWGSLLTLVNYFKDGYWPVGYGEHGIFGIDPKDMFLSLNFFNYFWILPLTIFYIFLHKNKFSQSLKYEVVFLIILIFIIFSKILTPQYIFWFIPIFPLFFTLRRNKVVFSIVFLVILLIAALSQYIYPLHYSELLGIFYTSGQKVYLFYLLLIRNLLLIILFTLVFYYVLIRSNSLENEKNN